MKKRVAVIGGGASGLTAALMASEKCSVVVFEKQKKIGRKILITGNGRCNISNTESMLQGITGIIPVLSTMCSRSSAFLKQRIFSDL